MYHRFTYKCQDLGTGSKIRARVRLLLRYLALFLGEKMKLKINEIEIKENEITSIIELKETIGKHYFTNIEAKIAELVAKKYFEINGESLIELINKDKLENSILAKISELLLKKHT